MSKRRGVLAVFMALLVVAAVPAQVGAASPQLAVGSQHDTATDFNNAQTLTNLTVDGSGSSASVDLITDNSFDQFDGETADTRHTLAGDDTLDTTYSTELRIEPTKDIITESLTVGINSTTGSDYGFVVDIYAVKEAPDGTYGEGTLVKDDWDPSFSSGDQTITLDKTVNMKSGETWTFEFVTQSTDNDGTDDRLLINASTSGSKTWIDVSGSTYDDIPDVSLTGRGDRTPANYTSQVHNVTNPEAAAVNITTANNVSINATVRTKSGTVLNQTTLTSAANHTLTLSSTSSEKIVTELNITSTGTSPDFSLEDESILFNNTAPAIDNGSASPTGGTKITNKDVTLSINVSDADFGTAQGESLTVDWYVDGSQVDTTTTGNNGTVSTTTTVTTGGNHTWHVEVTDEYGETTTSQSFQFRAPGNITFLRESNPNKTIDNVEVQITAYYDDQVQRRNVTDGTLNLSGFPIDQPIIIRANASGYYTRTVVIESVYDQANMYLLNDSKPAYLVRFELQDLIGAYPKADTVLIIERDIKLNNSTEWRAIAGDNFGVNGVSAHLRQDERFRLRIKNLETGRTAVVGSYTAIQSETVTLSTGSASITIPDSDTPYGYAVSKNRSSQTIHFRYEDDAGETVEVKLTVHERFNKSNVLVNNITFSNANTISYQKSLTANQTNTTWMAEIYVDRGGKLMHFRAPLSGGMQSIVPSNLDSAWVTGIGVFIILISSLAFSQLNVGVGAIATSLTGGILWWFGLLEGIAIGPVVVVSIALAVAYHYYSSPTVGGAA